MYPFVLAAGAIAFYFIVAVLQRPRPAEMLAVILWAAYSVYEYYVANGTLCDANCNIRVDLVLFFPLLGSASYLAVQKEPRKGTVAILYVTCLAIVGLLAAAFGYNATAVIAGMCALIAAIYSIRLIISGNRV
jgi:peptidoglycan/LPS O-acetylase OafA/YrhL